MTRHDTRINPFPGLRPFESSEAHLFFGRDDQKDELLRQLRRTRFVAVLGTSGSGKSSLVRAGLIPSLYGGMMNQAGSEWRVAILRPGFTPIPNLAMALNGTSPVDDFSRDAEIQTALAEATLRRTSLGLVELVRQMRMPPNENVLVVVDQFEEIFRFHAQQTTDDDTTAFVKLLLEAAAHHEIPIYVVLTMRADYLGDFAKFWELPAAHNFTVYPIPQMTREQCREAITGPIAVSGGDISPPLVNRLLNDLGDRSDQLPILQHTLMRTWDCWQEGDKAEPLDLRHYEAIGGTRTALSRHAEEGYHELPNDRSRELAEKVFKSLTEKGVDNRDIRRPTRVAEIAAIANSSAHEVISVIEPFRARSFLMPAMQVELGTETVIDISHESLIRGWDRLRQWVDEEFRSVQVYRRLVETAQLHAKGSAALWHDPDLTLALRWRDINTPNAAWARRYHPDFDTAMSFLDQSVAARNAELAASERYRLRRLKWTRAVATALAVMALFLVSLSVYSNRLRREAETQRRLADMERIQALKLKDEVEKQKTVIEQMMKHEQARADAADASAKSKNSKR